MIKHEINIHHISATRNVWYKRILAHLHSLITFHLHCRIQIWCISFQIHHPVTKHRRWGIDMTLQKNSGVANDNKMPLKYRMLVQTEQPIVKDWRLSFIVLFGGNNIIDC